jgi:16S rRNA (uracil1498-N3)-methyltransferase
MNCVVLYPHEISNDGIAIITGERGRHLIERHGLVEGITVRAAIFGEALGYISVLSVEKEALELRASVICKETPPARLPIDLLVAVPRPQTIKKLLLLAASTGVRSLVFFGSDKGDKSYLQSKMLKAEAIGVELLLGIEQACDACVPMVSVERCLDAWLEKGGLDGHGLFFADTVSTSTVKDVASLSITKPSFKLAVGGEAGWSERERKLLSSAGFNSISLGQRMLRVEHAAHSLIAQVCALGL